VSWLIHMNRTAQRFGNYLFALPGITRRCPPSNHSLVFIRKGVAHCSRCDGRVVYGEMLGLLSEKMIGDTERQSLKPESVCCSVLVADPHEPYNPLFPLLWQGGVRRNAGPAVGEMNGDMEGAEPAGTDVLGHTAQPSLPLAEQVKWHQLQGATSQFVKLVSTSTKC